MNSVVNDLLDLSSRLYVVINVSCACLVEKLEVSVKAVQRAPNRGNLLGRSGADPEDRDLVLDISKMDHQNFYEVAFSLALSLKLSIPDLRSYSASSRTQLGRNLSLLLKKRSPSRPFRSRSRLSEPKRASSYMRRKNSTRPPTHKTLQLCTPQFRTAYCRTNRVMRPSILGKILSYCGSL